MLQSEAKSTIMFNYLQPQNDDKLVRRHFPKLHLPEGHLIKYTSITSGQTYKHSRCDRKITTAHI